MTRRTFLYSAAAAPLAAASPSNRPVLCIFSKHMAQFNYDELGSNAKQIGFEGIDLTVRAKGHVLPERAAQDLPRAADAIRDALPHLAGPHRTIGDRQRGRHLHVGIGNNAGHHDDGLFARLPALDALG